MKYKHARSGTQFREKKFKFDDLVGPVKKMAIPQHGPQNKLAKLYNQGHKYQNGLHKQIKAAPKLAHIRSNKRYIGIFASFFAFPRPRSSK